jgi:organic radical activating enzyme
MKLRLLFTKDCIRNCEGCCNKQWDLDKLPVFDINSDDTSMYSEILITGGEPLLYPERLYKLLFNLYRKNFNGEVYIYTAWTKLWSLDQLDIIKFVDGFTITIHDQQAADEFVETEKQIRLMSNDYKGMSMRLNVFEGCTLSSYIPEEYKIKENMKWNTENCPLPQDEVFMRI